MTECPPKICRRMISHQQNTHNIVIVRHPESVCVPVNYKVTLCVRAEGFGVLNYQWFTSDNQEVYGATQADLTVKAKKNLPYVCRVNDQFSNCVFSEWAKVKVLDVNESGLPEQWQGNPHIFVNPEPQRVRPGEKVTLCCAAFGIPSPRYQWYRNGLLLLDQTSESLQIDGATWKHEGSYLCAVSNRKQEIWTEAADIHIVPVDPHPAAMHTVPIDRHPAAMHTATDKVALLIGNLNYYHHPGLLAPTMDVHELANLLQQLGFRVVSLLDLTREEMEAKIDEFIQLLDWGVYGLFYYAGHGYERSGRNYLVPVDAPQLYQPAHCVCVQRVMLDMQEKSTALSVILLDTCRKWYNQACIPSEIMPSKPHGNTVYGYATCEDAEAFEVQDGGKSTGIFTKYLNKHILQSKKVTHILEQVSEDLGRDPLVIDKQVVEIKHTMKEPRSLADPVRTIGHTRELQLRDACWRRANELPKRIRLVFHCGVEVEPMEDIFSRPGRSEEMDSLLHNGSDNPDCTLRLCALQKLQGSLVIKVNLHYTDMDSKLRLKESKQRDIGKPLVASCRGYKKNHVGTAKRQDVAQSLGDITNSKPPTRQNLGGHCRPFTRKAECAPKVKAACSNEPEENDEREL
ncbi:mucosa-associated lymphoid tissue lymphoma translocation protein 1 homolog isoform X2 [Lampris incognitus]|uniref:mucosa-associated lymphoid tissue lymphoma translocation protein 1 homolog isoform X2 n=1 Tax=Lampris incognitus TaxID=2546036 RepID=UPI0024B4A727|nr:mucosa-associated lymphoid tissue lymphoma translocation protein 1 homolog isoform X2 [Lampris incognitus]